MLFCVYSPAHVFLWMLWNAGNWIMMAAVMAAVSFQVRTVIPSFLFPALTRSYQTRLFF
jgi:hypothetical protein